MGSRLRWLPITVAATTAVAGFLAAAGPLPAAMPVSTISNGGVVASSPASATEQQTAGLSPACRRAERSAARTNGLWRVIAEVTGSPTGDAARAKRILNNVTNRITQRLRMECGTIPGPYRVFLTQVDRATDRGRFGLDELDDVLVAWLRWGEKIDAPQTARAELRSLRWCRTRFWPRLAAWYEVTSTPTTTGLAWRLTLSFNNRTGNRLSGGTDGLLRITGWKERPSHPGPGTTARLPWGGSSADVLDVRRGTSTRTVGPFAAIHTTSSGKFKVLDFNVGLVTRQPLRGCTVPVGFRP